MMNKKGDSSLEVLVSVIPFAILFVFIVVSLFSGGFLGFLSRSFSIFLASAVNTIVGILIDVVSTFLTLMFLLVSGLLIGLNVVPVIGTASYAALVYTAYDTFQGAMDSMAHNLPLYEPKFDVIRMGSMEDGKCGKNAYSSEEFKKQVAELTADCWAMYGKGDLDPFFARTPPNPRDCFIIHFNLNQSVSTVEMIDYLFFNNASSGRSYAEISGGIPLVEGGGFLKSSDIRMQKGIMFIKYGDELGFNTYIWGDDEWDSADCSIRRDFSPPPKTSIASAYLKDKMENYGLSDLEKDLFIAAVSPAMLGAIYGEQILVTADKVFTSDYVYWCFDEDQSYQNCGDDGANGLKMSVASPQSWLQSLSNSVTTLSEALNG